MASIRFHDDLTRYYAHTNNAYCLAPDDQVYLVGKDIGLVAERLCEANDWGYRVIYPKGKSTLAELSTRNVKTIANVSTNNHLPSNTGRSTTRKGRNDTHTTQTKANTSAQSDRVHEYENNEGIPLWDLI